MIPLKDTTAVIRLVGRRMSVLLKQRGIGGTAAYCVRYLGSLPQRLPLLLREATYDRELGVETSRLVAATDLGVDPGKIGEVGKNARGTAYMPSPAWALTAIFADLRIHYPDFTFIDLGSGMGRVVLMAAEFPFRKVIGVEFSPELHRTAEQNVARVSGRRRASAVEVVCQDAREYAFPPGNCIIYLFNPFQEGVMRTVLQNLGIWFESQSAELYVIYFHPVLGAVLDESSFLVKIKATPQYSIYQARKG
jgi:SAM-dependent methyltransferase